MRRSRLIALVLVGLLGIWLQWRQLAQRQRAKQSHNYAPESSLPAWIPAPTTNTDLKKLASTAEQTHNQSDALTQPQEPAPPPPPDTDSALPATALESEASEDNATESEDSATESETETTAPDDLIRIEGIGPKISTIVAAAGITSFAELASQEVARLEGILHEAGIHTAN